MHGVATLIAADGLGGNVVRDARDRLRAAGARCGDVDWLAPEVACDLFFDGIAPTAADAALADMGGLDRLCQTVAGRRKHLLVADMDGTVVTGETLDELAAFAGQKERVAAITARAMKGELDFERALEERVALLNGISTDALEKTWARIDYTPGARELVATMRAHGARCVLVSGGFTFFTGRVAAELGFHDSLANRLLEANGRLTGGLAKPVLDGQAKVAALERFAAARGITVAGALAVGDGANDLAMLRRAGSGVAFHARPTVRAGTRLRVDTGDLTALLYLQGYRRTDFTAAFPVPGQSSPDFSPT